ncbi:dihydroneopterin aldolase [bacterium]|nr:dihydroneopterin aldolase [bacterium]MBU1958798.1 dihydroneopterin aldolase [bacterium]
MTIHIEELTLSAIIGILDFERIKTQTVVIDATIDYFYSTNKFINYAEVIQLMETLIIEKKYTLLEDALSDIQNKLLENYPQIVKYNLKITKPDIINNAKVALSIRWKKHKH